MIDQELSSAVQATFLVLHRKSRSVQLSWPTSPCTLGRKFCYDWKKISRECANISEGLLEVATNRNVAVAWMASVGPVKESRSILQARVFQQALQELGLVESHFTSPLRVLWKVHSCARSIFISFLLSSNPLPSQETEIARPLVYTY